MKKKALLYSIVLATGMSFSGCSDQFLQDMTPYDKYSPEMTFGIESNLDSYIQNVYYNYFYKSGMTPTQSYGLLMIVKLILERILVRTSVIPHILVFVVVTKF